MCVCVCVPDIYLYRKKGQLSFSILDFLETKPMKKKNLRTIFFHIGFVLFPSLYHRVIRFVAAAHTYIQAWPRPRPCCCLFDDDDDDYEGKGQQTVKSTIVMAISK